MQTWAISMHQLFRAAYVCDNVSTERFPALPLLSTSSTRSKYLGDLVPQVLGGTKEAVDQAFTTSEAGEVLARYESVPSLGTMRLPLRTIIVIAV